MNHRVRSEWDVFDVMALVGPLRVMYFTGEVTQASLAEMFAISYTTVQRLLVDERPHLTLATAVRLAAFFGRSLDELAHVPGDDLSDLVPQRAA